MNIDGGYTIVRNVSRFLAVLSCALLASCQLVDNRIRGSIRSPLPPVVLKVTSSTSDGLKRIDDIIEAQVNFSQPVQLAGGLPSLEVALDSGSVSVPLASGGDGTSATLTFQFTVAPGQLATELDYTSTSALQLNGATLKGTNGNDAVTTLPPPGAHGSLSYETTISIDGIAPTPPSGASLASSSTYSLSTTPIVSFSSGSDAETGLSHHEVRLLRQSDQAVIQNWINLTSNQAVTNLNLEDGETYDVQVRAVDMAGNPSASV